MSKDRDYSSAVMRIAGNIAGGMIGADATWSRLNEDKIASTAVRIARAIVAEVKRTEPAPADPQAETSAP